jgi:hypothetical protein
VKHWETIADKLSKAGWSLGWVSAIDSEGRTIFPTRCWPLLMKVALSAVEVPPNVTPPLLS